MMSRIRSTLLLSVVLWALAGQSSAAHADCVDVALVLTVDSSASVSAEEFALQQNGIAGAFRSPEVQDAVRMAGRVAVSIIIWGSEGQVRPQSGWMLLDGEEGAEAVELAERGGMIDAVLRHPAVGRPLPAGDGQQP